MKLLRKILAKEVTVEGLDFWGRPSSLTFGPHPEKKVGWWWRVAGELVPIDHALAEVHRRRVRLAYHGHFLEVYEHIGALRFFGYDGVVVDGEGWPPHDGSARAFVTALDSVSDTTDSLVSWNRTSVSSRFRYPSGERSISLQPADELFLDVTIGYPKVGEQNMKLRLADIQEQKKAILCSRSQGFPHYLLPVLCLGENLRKVGLPVPVARNASWYRELGSRTGQQWLDHRVLDLLGALSLIFQDALPLCRVTSDKSGHLGDILAIRKLHQT